MKTMRWLGAAMVSFFSLSAHAETKLPELPDTLVGAGTFVPSYVGLMIAGAMTSERGHAEWGFNACMSVTAVPVAGPIMALFVAEPQNRAALAVDSVAQLAGAGFMVSGILWPKLNLGKSVMPVPMFSQDMTGMMFMGKF
jgi:hypothetical protein